MFLQHNLRLHFLSTAAPPVLLTGILYLLQHTSSKNEIAIARRVVAGVEEAQCLVDSLPQDTCTFVREYCKDFDNDGLLPYLRTYYCVSSTTRPYLLIGMFLWLMVLFSSMATAAGDFLSVHLAVIVRVLNISEHLAGVTIFAFGNGSSDLFSTLAAMNSNNGGLAIGELFGAGAFITSVVLGFVAIIQPFQVDPNHFIGDVVWFIIAASTLIAFLADGSLVLGECLGIIALYIAFVCFVLLRSRGNAISTNSDTTSEHSRECPRLEDSVERLPEHSEFHDHSPTSETNAESEAIPIENAASFGNAQQDADQQPLLPTTREDEQRVSVSTSSVSCQQQSNSSLELMQERSVFRMFPPLLTWNGQSLAEKFLTVLSLPLLVPIGLTTPMVPSDTEDIHIANTQDDRNSSELTEDSTTPVTGRWWQLSSLFRLLAPKGYLWIQLILGPQFLVLVLAFQAIGLNPTTPIVLVVCFTPLIVLATLGFCSLIDCFGYTHRVTIVRSLLISILSFTVSLTWIYLIATSAVTLLMTLGFILRIPTAILGATIFAVGNSSNDLVANTAVARRGFPVLAASACVGGPMMNMLLGIGGGGLIQVLKNRKGTTEPRAGVYSFRISSGLFVSASSLLVGLGVTLTYAFYNSWQLDRRLGTILIGVWIGFTIVIIGMGMNELNQLSIQELYRYWQARSLLSNIQSAP